MSALYPLHRGKWFVSCRFIYDCELFNEWGNELDYEYEDGTISGGVVVDAAVGMETGMGMSSTAKKSRGRKKLSSLSSPSDHSKLLLSNDLPVAGAILGTEKLMLNVIPLSTAIASKDQSATDMMMIQVSSLSNPNIQALQSSERTTIGMKRVSAELDDDPVAITIPDSMHVPRLIPCPNPEDNNSAAAVDSHRNAHLPAWFDQQAVSAVEHKLLGDVCSADPAEYLLMRNTIVNLYEQNNFQYITGTVVYYTSLSSWS